MFSGAPGLLGSRVSEKIMPELPEVETIKRDLERIALGKKIVDLKIYDGRVIRDRSLDRFKARLLGKTIVGISRRGKAIIIRFQEEGYLIVQLMMTGQLIYGENFMKRPSDGSTLRPATFKGRRSSGSTKLTFLFCDGSFLNYNDHRLFGRLTRVDELSQVKFLNTLGPEPWDAVFNFEWLQTKLKKHTMPIKSLLMNQSFVAGIGNIYASEILFRARINPRRPARSLTKGEIRVLHRMTTRVLEEAIQGRGTSMNTYRDTNGEKGIYSNRIKVYGRENERCFRCKKPIQRIVQAGRSTFFCRNCQS